MLEFVRKAFAGLVEIILWLVLLACIIVGSFLGDSWYGDPPIGAIFGGVIGTLIGFLVITIFGGYIATFLRIGEAVNEIADEYADMLEKISNTDRNISEILDVCIKMQNANREKITMPPPPPTTSTTKQKYEKNDNLEVSDLDKFREYVKSL